MEATIKWIDKISRSVGKLFGWLIIPLVGSLCYEVFARYLFRSPTIWAFDLTYMLMSAIFLAGAAYTLSEKRHIKIDFLYLRFPSRVKHVSDLVGFVVLISPVIAYVAYFAVMKLVWAIQVEERSDLSPWHPLMWPFRGCIALGFVLLFLQCISEIMKQILNLVSKQRG